MPKAAEPRTADSGLRRVELHVTESGAVLRLHAADPARGAAEERYDSEALALQVAEAAWGIEPSDWRELP